MLESDFGSVWEKNLRRRYKKLFAGRRAPGGRAWGNLARRYKKPYAGRRGPRRGGPFGRYTKEILYKIRRGAPGILESFLAKYKGNPIQNPARNAGKILGPFLGKTQKETIQNPARSAGNCGGGPFGRKNVAIKKLRHEHKRRYKKPFAYRSKTHFSTRRYKKLLAYRRISGVFIWDILLYFRVMLCQKRSMIKCQYHRPPTWHIGMLAS